MEILRRTLSALLALVMVVTMLPLSALAEETDPTITETAAETEPVDVGEVVLDVPLTDETETVETVPETTEAVMETDVATEPAETVPETTVPAQAEETMPEETLYVETSSDPGKPLYGSANTPNTTIEFDSKLGLKIEWEYQETAEFDSVRVDVYCLVLCCNDQYEPDGVMRWTAGSAVVCSGGGELDVDKIWANTNLQQISIWEIRPGFTSIGKAYSTSTGFINNSISYPYDRTLESKWSIKDPYDPDDDGYVYYYNYEGKAMTLPLIIPEGVETISDWAIENVGNVQLPSTLKTLPTHFGKKGYSYYSKDVERVPRMKISGGNPYFSSDAYGAVYSKDKSELIRVPSVIGTWGEDYTYAEIGDDSYIVPEGVKRLGSYAFLGSQVQSVYLPSSLEEIEYYFDDSNVKNIHVTNAADWLELDFGGSYCNPFIQDKEMRLFAGGVEISPYVIQEGTTKIGNYALSRTPMDSITIPDSVTHIGKGAFLGSALSGDIFMPDSVVSIDYDAFQDTGITSIHLSDNVTEIGGHTFSGCKNLTEVHMPKNLEIIAYGAFEGCDALTDIHISDINNWLEVSIWDSYNVPVEEMLMYGKNLYCNGNLLTDLEITPIYDSETSYYTLHVTAGTFTGCSSLETVRLDRVASLGAYAFKGCENLENVEIQFETYKDSWDCVEAFADCTNLQTVDFYGEPAIFDCNYETYEFEADWSKWEGIFNGVTATITYPGDSEIWQNADVSSWGGNLTLEPRGAKIETDIASQDVYTSPMICGTVYNQNGNSEMQPSMTLTPSEKFTNVELTLTLPEGFSFERDKLTTEKTVPVGDLPKEDTIILPTIYPIYIDEADQTKEYTVTVDITGTNSSGEEWKGKEKEVFYRPSHTRNTAQNLSKFEAADYVFSLNSAKGSGNTYNQETAQLCALLSNTAYDEGNMEAFLVSGLGFTNYVRYGDTGNLDHKIVRYFASKQIIENGEIKNLVYVVCRGTVTLQEWISNFTTGIGKMLKDHEGFAGAAYSVSSQLKDYYAKNEFSPENTIFVVTGHSRGAAVANLVGQWLNTSAGLASKENISVYTFETPTVNKNIVSEQAGYLGNENIFNFVNYQDAIRNAPSMQYYGRYGSTRYFAFNQAAPGESTLFDGFGTYDLPDDGSNFTMPELLNSILFECDVDNPTAIKFALSDVLRLLQLSVMLYKSNPKVMVDELLNAHVSGYYEAAKYNAPYVTADEVNIRTVEAGAYLQEKIKALDAVEDKIKDVMDIVFHGFHCPINLYVYDNNGNLAASIVDKQITCNDENLIVYVNGDELNIGYFKSEQANYTIKVEGYDNGTMTHCIQTVGIDGFKDIQVRRDIPIVKDSIWEVGSDGYIEDASGYTKYEDPQEIEDILTNLDNPAPSHDFQLGDVNHDTKINAKDATLILQSSVGVLKETAKFCETCAEVSGDGKLNAKDSTLILQFSVGLRDSFPAAEK